MRSNDCASTNLDTWLNHHTGANEGIIPNVDGTEDEFTLLKEMTIDHGCTANHHALPDGDETWVVDVGRVYLGTWPNGCPRDSKVDVCQKRWHEVLKNGPSAPTNLPTKAPTDCNKGLKRENALFLYSDTEDKLKQ